MKMDNVNVEIVGIPGRKKSLSAGKENKKGGDVDKFKTYTFFPNLSLKEDIFILSALLMVYKTA